MTTWTDKAGRRLTVLPAEGDNPARLAISFNGSRASESARFWLDGNADLAEIAVALFTANGHPAPVITPRPDVDPREWTEFGPLRMKASQLHAGQVMVQAGAVTETWAPSHVRMLAGVLVALADAAESEPGPAEVEALGNLIAEERSLAGSVELARKILLAGWKREASDG